MSYTMLPYNIALIGFMGTGKSTVADALQKQTGSEIIDVDAMIVDTEGMAINDIFAKHGEPYFRDCERDAVLKLTDVKNSIIACGGGLVMRDENVENLKKFSKIVLLTATPETVFERVRYSKDRPILNGHMNVKFISELMEKRRARYEEVADIIIKTDGRKIKDICDEILQKMD